MQYHLLLTAGDRLPSFSPPHFLRAIHSELLWEAVGGSSQGSPMGPVDSTPLKMPSHHVYKPSGCSSCLLLCLFTVPRPKKIKLLAITNVSNNDGFTNTKLYGPREDFNSTKRPKVMGVQTGRWTEKNSVGSELMKPRPLCNGECG